jgi:hypothetical protein
VVVRSSVALLMFLYLAKCIDIISGSIQKIFECSLINAKDFDLSISPLITGNIPDSSG